jgi:REP element-mobilizing transposase RayT
MPRQARIDAPGALHHIICRGIERSRIFTDNIDREDFIRRLEAILAETSTVCYAWALIPNHFHLLLRTAATSISTVMRRLLTGYAVTFNHRHNRSGHLFQNRYKSIICQDDLYLLELVRYIHLNPLRAKLVDSIETLAGYDASGHRQLLGLTKSGLVAVDDVLSLFGNKREQARHQYAAFVADGLGQGKRPELVGGGLRRSLADVSLRSNPSGDERMVSDERILGKGEFVEAVLRRAEIKETARQRYQCAGFDLTALTNLVAEMLEVDYTQVQSAGKQPKRVMARSLFCYWAVRELGHSATMLGRMLGLSQPAVSQAVHRGEMLAAERSWQLSRLTIL